MDIVQEFFEAEVRCETLIPISMCLSQPPSDVLRNAIEQEEDVCFLLGIDDQTLERLCEANFENLDFLSSKQGI